MSPPPPPLFGPVESVAAANQWHDEHRDEHDRAGELSDCWCCCVYCEDHSPHYTAAIGGWNGAAERTPDEPPSDQLR